jgi:PAS domain S-box-containing protein
MVDQNMNSENIINELMLKEQENQLLKLKNSELSLANDTFQKKIMNCEAIFESSPVAMFIIDENTNIVMVNLAAVKLCGGSEEEILQHRPGNALRCVHSVKDPRGCGYATDCKTCEVRNGIESLIANGGTISGAQLEFTLTQNDKPQSVWMNVGVEPVMKDGVMHWCIAMSDISESKHIEESLRISEERFRGIFNNLQDAFFQADLSGNFILVSPSALRMYGYDSFDEMMGMPASNLYANSNVRDHLINELRSKGEITDFVEKGKRKDGSTFWVSMNVRLMYQNGNVSGTEGIVRDITERKLAEKFIDDLIEKNPLSIQILDKNGFTLKVNTAHSVLFGAPPPSNFSIFADLQNKGFCEYILIAKKGEVVHLPDIYYNVHDDFPGLPDKPVWIRAVLFPLTDSTGNIERFVFMHEDITERKLSEEKLQQSESMLLESQKIAGLGTYSFDITTGIFHTSKIMDEIFGIDETYDHSFNGWSAMIHPDDQSMMANYIINEVIGEKQPFNKEFRIIRQNDNLTRWLHALGNLENNSHGQTIKLVGTCQDITEQKNVQKELIEEKRKTEESEYRLKLATASGRLGIWDWNLVENSMIWDDRMFELYGITRDTFPNNIDAWTNGQHPEDKQMALDECNAALSGEREFNTSFRVLHPDGTILYLKANGSVLRDENGKPLRMIGINRDVTASRLAAKQLQVEKEKAEESEMVFRKLFEDSSDAQLLFKDGKFVNCNNATLKLLGTNNTADIIGLSPMDIAPELQPDKRLSLDAAIEYTNIAFDDGFCQFEWLCKRFDGKLILLDIILMPIVLRGEKHLHGTWRDITERKKAEQALTESEERYRNLFQKSHAIMLLIEPETGAIMDANPAACNYYGWNRDELLKMKLDEINILDSKGIIDELFLARTEKRNYFIFKHRLANHSIRDVEVYSSPLVLAGKTLLYSIIHDITDRKQAEEALVIAKEKAEESEESYRRIIETANEGIWMMDKDHQTTYVNDKMALMLGFSSSEIIGKKVETFMLEEDLPVHYERMKLRGSGLGGQYEHRFKRKDGLLLWTIVSATVLKNERGEFEGSFAMFTDITAIKQKESELQIAKERAEESDRLKTSFLANMSHEIRTPLNSIIGFSDLLIDPDFDSDQKQEFVNLIKNSGNNLISIINDIIDISKIETGQVPLTIEQFSLNDLINEIGKEFSYKAEEKGLKFLLNIPESQLQVTIKSDPKRMKQILTSFLNNAIKFTEKGFVELGFIETTDSVHVFVKDSGIGIAKQFHEQIFERFWQVESAHTRKYGGNGLGLAISKQLAELLGYKLRFESVPDKGSTFYISSPIS